MWFSAGALILLLGLLTLLLSRVGARAAKAQMPSGERDQTAKAQMPLTEPAQPGATLATRLRRWLARIGAAACLAMSALCFYAWYAFYLKWDFNELGRYYDPIEHVVYTSSGAVWILPATVLLVVGMAMVWRGWRR